MYKTLSSDAHDLLLVAICIVGALLLIAFVRIWFLLRTNRRLTVSHDKMEQLVLSQHRDALDLRRDSNAWRGAMQTQLDAFRAESSRRLEDSEMRFDQVMKQHESSLASLQAMLKEALDRKPEPAPPPPAPPPVAAAEPAVPKPFPPPPSTVPLAMPPPMMSVLPSDIVLPRIDEPPAAH